MRILQIHNYYATRGGECWVVDAERKLLETRGHDVMQYTRNSKELSSSTMLDKAYSYWNIPNNRDVERDLNSFIEDNRPDIAHVHNIFPLLSPSVFVALRKQRVPIVQTVHNFRFLCPNGTFFTHGEVCERCLSKGYNQAVKFRCVRNSLVTSLQYTRSIKRLWKTGVLTDAIDRFIALNEFSLAKLTAGGIPVGKITICGNFSTSVEEAPGDKGNYFLYLGRLSPEKGVLTLISAARLLKCCRLKIAGSGPLEAEIQRAVAGDNNIEYLGYVEGERKTALIAAARAMVVPSEWYENFPISVVESMSNATPVIASRIGGLPEMVEHNHTGLLFEPGDSAGLAQCMRLLSTNADLSDSMAHAALHYAHQQFSPERHVMELERLYADTLADARH